ncbi:MerR family transcriptional regulator [Actinomadura keratinilytica]
MMRIGELATRTHVSVRALRYYEEHTLLTPDRTPSGQRHYPESAVARVHLIQQLYAAPLQPHHPRPPPLRPRRPGHPRTPPPPHRTTQHPHRQTHRPHHHPRHPRQGDRQRGGQLADGEACGGGE